MTLEINGTQHDALANWKISQKAGSNTVSSFQIKKNDSFGRILPGDHIVLKNGASVLFSGYAEEPKTPAFNTGNEIFLYSVNCNNENALLANRIPLLSYQEKSLQFIVTDIFNKYISKEGITLGEISTITELVFNVYNSATLNLQAVLNELASYVNGSWEITPDRKFYFKIFADFEKVVTINKSNYKIMNLQHSASKRDLRTAQLVGGINETTGEQQETFICDKGFSASNKTAQTFSVVYKLAKKPIIERMVSGSVAESYGNVTADKNSNPEMLKSMIFLYEQGTQEISLNSNYTGTKSVPTGALLRITYFGLYPVLIRLDDIEKQVDIHHRNGSSGIIENYVRDESIKTAKDGKAYAQTLMESYGTAKETLKLKSTGARFQSIGIAKPAINTLWAFDLPEYDITGDYVLTEYEQTPLIDAENEFEYSLTFTSRNFVQNYAETIQRLYQKKDALSVRENELIVLYMQQDDKISVKDEISYKNIIRSYVCDEMREGQIATPLGSVLNYVCE